MAGMPISPLMCVASVKGPLNLKIVCFGDKALAIRERPWTPRGGFS